MTISELHKRRGSESRTGDSVCGSSARQFREAFPPKDYVGEVARKAGSGAVRARR